MIEYKEVKWYRYQGVLLPKTPPHQEISLTDKEAKKLLKLDKAFFVRYTNEWDRKSGNFWYIIKDEKENLDKYSSNTRSKIRRGLKRCKVEKVTKEYIAEYAYNVYRKAFDRYKTFLKPTSKENFSKNILDSENIDYWGVFIDDRIVAYSQNIIQDNSVNYSVIKFDPEFLKYYISYALFFEMNKYYINEQNFLYVNDGARSLSHETNIQEFLISKFKFRKAYCRLNIVYRKDIKLLTNILFPFRKILYKIDNNICNKLSVLLKQEEIRRSYD